MVTGSPFLEGTTASTLCRDEEFVKLYLRSRHAFMACTVTTLHWPLLTLYFILYIHKTRSLHFPNTYVVTKGQIEVTRRRGRRRKKLLDDLKDRRGYCQLKEEVLDRTMWEESFWKRLWTCRLTDYWWWWWLELRKTCKKYWLMNRALYMNYFITPTSALF